MDDQANVGMTGRQQFNVRLEMDAIAAVRERARMRGRSLQDTLSYLVAVGLEATRPPRRGIDELLDGPDGHSYAAIAARPDTLGIPTGLASLDRVTGGLRAGEFVVLAARPAQGKSLVAAAVADEVSASGVPVLFFSMEMEAGYLAGRLVASRARVGRRRFEQDHLLLSSGSLDSDPGARERLRESLAARSRRLLAAKDSLRESPLCVDDSPRLSLRALRESVEKASADSHERYGTALELVIVDYLQLLDVAGGADREDRETEIGREMQQLARDFDVAVLGLSQLARTAADDGSRRGLFLATAATVVELRRPHAGESVLPEATEEEVAVRELAAELLVLKCRSGATGELPAVFDDDAATVLVPLDPPAGGADALAAEYLAGQQ